MAQAPIYTERTDETPALLVLTRTPEGEAPQVHLIEWVPADLGDDESAFMERLNDLAGTRYGGYRFTRGNGRDGFCAYILKPEGRTALAHETVCLALRHLEGGIDPSLVAPLIATAAGTRTGWGPLFGRRGVDRIDLAKEPLTGDELAELDD